MKVDEDISKTHLPISFPERDTNDNSEHNDECRHLQSELGAPPVSPLGVVPDGVAGPHPSNSR